MDCDCGAAWTGLAKCHCGRGGCHKTFANWQSFDLHRVGNFDLQTRRCAHPQEVGLVVVSPVGQPFIWGRIQDAPRDTDK